MRKMIVWIVGLTLILINFSAFPQARAATITVTNNSDNDPGSLRQAVAGAGSNDIITFDSSLAGGTITLTSGEISIGTNLTIDGSSLSTPVSISGNGASRIFNIGNYTVTLDTLTLEDGYVSGDPAEGGAIYNNGSLALKNVTLTNNHADGGKSKGGAIYNNNSLNVGGSTFINNRVTSQWSYGGAIYNYGTLIVTDSTFSGNKADSVWASNGGAIYNDTGRSATLNNCTIKDGLADSGGGIFNAGTLTMIDCTIGENNVVYVNGGGIFNSGTATLTNCTIMENSGTGSEGGAGINNSGTMTLTNCTISGNVTNVDGGGIRSFGTLTLINDTITNNTADANGDGFGAGGGIYGFGTILVRNTIVAGNADLSSTGSAPDLYGTTFTSQGYNLIGKSDGSTGFTNGVNNDIVGTIASPVNPGLGALADNGGPTKTHALLLGSPALDAIAEGGTGYNGAPSTDQRGVSRPQGSRCDIGAYEYVKTSKPRPQLPSLSPLISTNISQADNLLKEANDLLSQTKSKNLDTSTCEKQINEVNEFLEKANKVKASPITANYYALKALEKVKQAVDCLKALLG